jgi:hypothetical protein
MTESFSESASESSDLTEESSAASAEDSTADSSTVATTAESAAAGSAPAQLGDGAPQPVTAAETVDPAKIIEPPAGADDDQMGELRTTATTSPVPTNADKPAVTAPAADKPAVSGGKLATKGGATSGKLQIIIPTAEVTVDQLKANDYTVDLLITLDQNPGITYSEWGLHLDKRCTYTADSDDLPIGTIFSIGDSGDFLWTAWTSGSLVTKTTGAMLKLHVKLPRDAKAGSSYAVTYADMSLQPAPHIWQNDDNNWVNSSEVGWTNGGVIVK